MAEAFKAIAVDAVEERGRFTVALTGGRSPRMLYRILHSEPYRELIPWNRSYVFWGDERAVPFDDDQNNAKMGFDNLLNHVPVPAEQIFRINSEIPPSKAAEEYEKELKQHFRDREPSFDLILLGMGADGHTASIFPGSDVVREQERWVSTCYNAEQGTDRITFTAPLLNKAKNIFFAVFGENKSNTLKDVLKGEYNPQSLPAQLIKPEYGEVNWYVDEEAAQFINVD
jgi:6-phosphogluconolactonase